MNKKTHYYWLFGLILVVLAVLIVSLMAIDPSTRKLLVRENGPIEVFTAVCYFVCVLLLLFLKEANAKSRLSIVFILMILGMRELDFHTKFTAMSMTKLKFYVSPHVPILEKMLGAVIVALLIWCLFYLSKKYFFTYLNSLRHKEPYAIGVFFAFLLLIMALGVDGYGKKLAQFGFAFSKHEFNILAVSEEVIELGIPVMFLMAIVLYSDRWISRTHSGKQ